MTCDGRIGGSSGFNFFNPITTGNTNKIANTGKTNEVASTPIQITGSNTTTRADLDNLSPYAALGVNISTAKDPVDVVRQAAPEFAQFTGNYTLENPVEANYDLADLNFALQARTEDGLNKYVDGHTNRALAEKHLQDGGFANFLEQLDIAVS